MPNPKLLSILNTLLAMLFCIGMATAQTAPNETDSQGRKQGLWEKYYEDGQLQYRATFKNDVPIGNLERYYEEGGLQAILEYKNPDEAYARLYYPEDTLLMAKGLYVDKLKEGKWVLYSQEQTLSAREIYKEGVLNGEKIVYYSDGSVAEKVNYIDGKKNGVWEQFFEDGTPQLTATVQDGVKYIGEYVSYYPNGNKFLKGKYNDGMKNGTWLHFHEDGSLQAVYLYRGDKIMEEYPKNGVFEEYYPNDIKSYEYTYKNGEKDGPFVEFYNLGEWVTEESVDEYGYKRPVQKLYGTQVKREGEFKNGQLHGLVKEYNEKGKLISSKTYNLGEEVD